MTGFQKADALANMTGISERSGVTNISECGLRSPKAATVAYGTHDSRKAMIDVAATCMSEMVAIEVFREHVV